MNTKMDIVLASGSPRRREILEQAGIHFRVEVSEIDEKISSHIPSEIVQELSAQKAEAVACRQVKDCIVIGSDTIVAFGGDIMGKPRDREDAARMLQELSGNTHQVYSGVTVLEVKDGEIRKRHTFFEKTDVHVAVLTGEEIEEYVETGEPLDKAGAYAIQGRFLTHITGITGDYYNVVGLPIAHLYEVLKDFLSKSSGN